MKSLTVGSFVSLFVYCSIMSLPAAAQEIHWGFDSRPVTLDTCRKCAMQELASEGMPPQDSGNVIFGSNNDGNVLVTCVPQNNGSFIMVTGISNVPGMAEKLRNKVRERVFGCRRLD
jgi:hypothetical protein